MMRTETVRALALREAQKPMFYWLGVYILVIAAVALPFAFLYLIGLVLLAVTRAKGEMQSWRAHTTHIQRRAA
jgi:hypothetical protein